MDQENFMEIMRLNYYCKTFICNDRWFTQSMGYKVVPVLANMWFVECEEGTWNE